MGIDLASRAAPAARAPGNVLLAAGEGNLPRQSLVNVSQIFTLDKSDLGEQIGKLGAERVRQILEGITLLLDPAGID